MQDRRLDKLNSHVTSFSYFTRQANLIDLKFNHMQAKKMKLGRESINLLSNVKGVLENTIVDL